MARKNNRVVFLATDVEYQALQLMAQNEDSQAALLRGLIREAARKRNIWDKACRKIEVFQKVEK